MNWLLAKYKNLTLLICLLLFAAVLLSNNIKGQRQANFFERTVLTLIMPLQNGVTSSIRKILGTWNHYFYLVDTAKENEKLRDMLHEQMFKNNSLREELKKFRRVESLITKSPAQPGNDAVVAGVGAWDSTNTAWTIVIDRGHEDGVKEGMIVLNHLGLVGRVVAVTKHAARVLLITDARSAVDAYIQRTRARCTVVGQNRKVCEIQYLSVKEDVKEGDTVISSGLGGIFPQGLRLGSISALEAGSSKLFFKAEMAPSSDLDHLEEVLAIGVPPGKKLDMAPSELDN